MVPELASLSAGEKGRFYEGMSDQDFDYHVLIGFNNSPGTYLVLSHDSSISMRKWNMKLPSNIFARSERLRILLSLDQVISRLS